MIIEHKTGKELEQYVGIFGFARLEGEIDADLRCRFVNTLIRKMGGMK